MWTDFSSIRMADGLLLKDGKEVHFPPHMSKAVLAAVKPGDHVKVRGVRPRFRAPRANPRRHDS